jgi:hypothetical protein
MDGPSYTTEFRSNERVCQSHKEKAHQFNGTMRHSFRKPNLPVKTYSVSVIPAAASSYQW